MLTLFRLLACLPLRLLHALGAAAGWLVYALSPSYRRRLEENLAAAIPQSGEVLRLAIAEAGKTAFETPAIWFRPASATAGMVVAVEGWAQVEAALARGKGILFLTPHLGCFELSAQYYALHHPLTVMYRPPRKQLLEPLMMAGRERPGLKPVPSNMSGVRALLKALKRGEAIGMLPDQAPRFGEGAWADFFGRPAYTMTLAGRLLIATGTQVMLAFAERLPAGRGFRIWFENGPLADDSAQFEVKMNQALETLIRRCPSQYLWGYDRYKVPRQTRMKAEG